MSKTMNIKLTVPEDVEEDKVIEYLNIFEKTLKLHVELERAAGKPTLNLLGWGALAGEMASAFWADGLDDEGLIQYMLALQEITFEGLRHASKKENDTGTIP